MLTKHMEAIDTLKNGEYEEAYKKFSRIYENDKNDYLALFYRAVTAFTHFPSKIEQTINDFERLIAINSPFKYQSMAYLVMIYCNNEAEKAIKYADEAIKHNPELYIDLNFALSRAYFEYGDDASLRKSLEYIDKCIEKDEGETSDFYICKVEILITLGKFEQAEEILDLVYTKFGGSLNYYYLTAKLKIAIYNKINDASFLDQALSDLALANQYEENNCSVVLLKVEIYALKKEKEKALKELEKAKEFFDDDSYLVEQFKIYEELGEDDIIVKIAYEYLKEHESWRIYYSLGFFLAKTAKSLIEIEELKSVYLKAYNLNKEIFIFDEIYRLNFILSCDYENLELLEDLIKLHPEDGRLRFLLGETKHRLNYNYDDVLNEFNASYELKYLDEFKYLTLIMPLTIEPKKTAKKLKKYQKKDFHPSDIWLLRKLGIMYLYGEDGFKQMPNFAESILEYCNNIVTEEACMKTALGRAHELNHSSMAAFKCYEEAYQAELAEALPVCNCANGYLAHAYINGIGTNVDEEKAKKLILEGISFLKEKSSNIVIYLYAYFALKGDKRFSLSTALSYLETKYPFYRYEISRAIMINIIRKKLSLSTKNSQEYIKLCLKQGNKTVKKYYNENKNKDLIYPLFNNY